MTFHILIRMCDCDWADVTPPSSIFRSWRSEAIDRFCRRGGAPSTDIAIAHLKLEQNAIDISASWFRRISSMTKHDLDTTRQHQRPPNMLQTCSIHHALMFTLTVRLIFADSVHLVLYPLKHPPVFLLLLIRLVPRPQGSATDWALCHAATADPLIQTNGRFLLAFQQSFSSYQFESCIIACLDSTAG